MNPNFRKIKDKYIGLFYEKFKNDADAMLLTGSQSSGLATSKSDVDLILLIGPSSCYYEDSDQYVVEFYNDTLCEILFLNYNSLNKIIQNYKQKDYCLLSTKELKIMEKVFSAKPIFGEKTWLSHIESVNFDQYAEKISARHIRLSIGDINDVIGAVNDERYLLAIDFLRNVLWRQAETLLCLTGDTNSRRKWLTSRLERATLLNPLIYQGFIEFNFLSNISSPNQLAVFIDKFQRFSQYLNYEIDRMQFSRKCLNILVDDKKNNIISKPFTFIVRTQGKFFLKNLNGDSIIDDCTARIILACHQKVNKVFVVNNIQISYDTATISDVIDKLIDLSILEYSN